MSQIHSNGVFRIIGAQFADKEGYFVRRTEDGWQLATATHPAHGIITRAGEHSADIAVIGAVSGTYLLRAGANVIAGDTLHVDPTSRVQPGITTTGGIGIALESATAGELFEASVTFIPPSVSAP